MVTQEQAIDIATKFQQAQTGEILRLRSARLTSVDDISHPRPVWSIVFNLNIPEGVAESPDICVVEVDLVTGEAKFFDML